MYLTKPKQVHVMPSTSLLLACVYISESSDVLNKNTLGVKRSVRL